MRYAENFCQKTWSLEGVTFTGPYLDGDGVHSVFITRKEYDAYNAGALIQNAFHRLSLDDREFLKTGISPEKWDELFKEEDEE